MNVKKIFFFKNSLKWTFTESKNTFKKFKDDKTLKLN